MSGRPTVASARRAMAEGLPSPTARHQRWTTGLALGPTPLPQPRAARARRGAAAATTHPDEAVQVTMAGIGWRRRVLEHLYDARGIVTVADLCALLGAEPYQVNQLLLGLEEEWLAVRQHRFHDDPRNPAVKLTAIGRRYVQRAYRAPSQSSAIAGNG